MKNNCTRPLRVNCPAFDNTSPPVNMACSRSDTVTQSATIIYQKHSLRNLTPKSQLSNEKIDHEHLEKNPRLTQYQYSLFIKIITPVSIWALSYCWKRCWINLFCTDSFMQLYIIISCSEIVLSANSYVRQHLTSTRVCERYCHTFSVRWYDRRALRFA